MRDITFLELIPILLAFQIWTSFLTHRKLILHVDNQALVCILNTKSSTSKRIMHILRPLVLLTMLHNVQFKSVHLSSCKNTISDSLSRQQWYRFRTLAPTADAYPSVIPAQFMKLISDPKLMSY
ncbi:hypothetical protein SNE40_010318 [Patella caerulea]|uniref:Uncharacterized protein n=1 Tax=Patella caerulea TaxID=87958 RepID=A0AAN8JUZ5_PATCE